MSYGGVRIGKLKRGLIIAAYDGRCWICGNRPETPTLDHVIPRRRGGDESVGNLRPACPRCNTARDRRLKAMPSHTEAQAIRRELTDTWWRVHPLPEFTEGGHLLPLDPQLADALAPDFRRCCPSTALPMPEEVPA